MSQTLARPETNDQGAIYESLALKGDLSGLSPADKVRYYGELCDRLGLDPMTQPFLPLKLNGKEILYPTRGATDQLARIHHVNRTIISRERLEDVYLVTVRAELPNGRTEESIGAVTVAGLKGDALCNALMKGETKAKRRVTLAILGLGMLDEIELETIPARAREELPPPQVSQHSEPKITSKQVQALAIALKEAGFKSDTPEGKAEGRAFLAFVLDWGDEPLESIRDLSKQDAQMLLDTFGHDTPDGYRADRDQLADIVTSWREDKDGLIVPPIGEGEGLEQPPQEAAA